MADKDMVTMSRKKLKRFHLIHQALDKKIRQANAAEILGLIAGQFRRLLRREE